jgi:hypothetical protein
MSMQVITEQEFEAARLAFSNAWLECDEKQKQGRIVGPRTTCGLTAALLVLGIKVDDHA